MGAHLGNMSLFGMQTNIYWTRSLLIYQRTSGKRYSLWRFSGGWVQRGRPVWAGLRYGPGIRQPSPVMHSPLYLHADAGRGGAKYNPANRDEDEDMQLSTLIHLANNHSSSLNTRNLGLRCCVATCVSD